MTLPSTSVRTGAQSLLLQIQALGLMIEAEQRRYPSGTMKNGENVGGQFMPLDETGGGGSTGSVAPKTTNMPEKAAIANSPELKKIVKDKNFQNLVEHLNSANPQTAEAFEEFLQSPDVAKFQTEMAKAMTGMEPTAEALNAHHAALPHGNGAVLGRFHGTKLETPVAGGMGLTLDFLVSSINEDIQGLKDIPGATQQQQELANLTAKVAPLLFILFSNVAPEVMLGATLAKAGTIGVVQVAAVTATTKAAEKAMEELDVENPAVKKAVEVVTMTVTGMTAREGYMKVAKSGAKVSADLTKAVSSHTPAIDESRSLIKEGDLDGAREALEKGLPKSVNEAADAASAKVVDALKQGKE